MLDLFPKNKRTTLIDIRLNAIFTQLFLIKNDVRALVHIARGEESERLRQSALR